MPADTASWYASMALRISRTDRRRSASFWRLIDTRASGKAADASTIMMAVATTSSMNVKPLDDDCRSHFMASLLYLSTTHDYRTTMVAGMNCTETG